MSNLYVPHIVAMGMGSIVFLAVLAGMVIVGAGGYFAIRSKVRDFSQTAFGTDDLMKGINQMADDVSNTPRSVNSMTRLMEPQIARDFPEFTWGEFRVRAENMLVSALNAISSENADKLVDASDEVRRQVLNQIGQNQTDGVRETYSNIHVHQTEIANYTKSGGKCIITIQSAIEYYHYKTKADHVTEGSRDRKVQTKYNMELMYIQDAGVRSFDNAVSTNCPNCGAPIANLGHKFCEYCGAAVEPINIKVWSLHSYYEVDHRHV